MDAHHAAVSYILLFCGCKWQDYQDKWLVESTVYRCTETILPHEIENDQLGLLLKEFKKLFSFSPGNANFGAIGHSQVSTIAPVIVFHVLKVDDMGMMYTKK